MDLSGRTLGEFRLRALIGEGGYGQVYLAEQPALEREVVVKVLREDRGSPGARERFLREARLAAQLRHPRSRCRARTGCRPVPTRSPSTRRPSRCRAGSRSW
jgi:serine/threonine protein kinase